MPNFQLQRRRVSKLKKFLAILLGAIFVLSFAASAFAIHAEIPSETQAVVAKGATQITIDGELRTRGWYLNNITSDRAPADVGSSAYYDERIRLSVDAKVSPNVEGYVQLESGSGQKDLYVWGNFNSKPNASPDFLQAWILYSGQGLFGFPSGVKIGHMPLYLGQKEFFDHSKFGDDAIVFFMLPTKELEIDLLTIKFAGDGNGLFLPTFPGVDPKGAAFGSKYDNTDDLDGYVGIVTYKMDPNNTFGLNYTYLNLSDLRFSHQDLGLTGSGNIAGLGYSATFDIQFGKVGDTKFKGWAAQAGLSYMLDPINLRAKFAYGSGPDQDSNDDKQFETYLGADQHYTLVYDYNLITTTGRQYSGLSNTTYYNLGADFAATKDLKASLDGYIIRASKTADGVSKDAGWEADAKVSYNIAKNLTYVAEAGYFKAGSFYEDSGLGEKKGATVLKHTLTLSF
jgi:hypothetical protein